MEHQTIDLNKKSKTDKRLLRLRTKWIDTGEPRTGKLKIKQIQKNEIVEVHILRKC